VRKSEVAGALAKSSQDDTFKTGGSNEHAVFLMLLFAWCLAWAFCATYHPNEIVANYVGI
jgi:hypothetical protein